MQPPHEDTGERGHPLVELLLLRRHVDAEDLLHLGRERLLHVLFDTAQKEGLQDFVETLIAVVPSLAVVVLKVLPGIEPAGGERTDTTYLKKALPGHRGVSDPPPPPARRDALVRHEEVQQRPELFEGVLQRGASDEEPVIGPELH